MPRWKISIALTEIGINNNYNDQAAFDAANNYFLAPEDGTYLFGATLLYKINASATVRMRGRLALNGTTEICSSFGEISATQVSLATAIWLQTMVPSLRAIPSTCRGISGSRMGISPPITRPSGAARLAERRKEDLMTPPRSEGLVRMPDAKCEAILTRTAEEGAKRGLAEASYGSERTRRDATG